MHSMKARAAPDAVHAEQAVHLGILARTKLDVRFARKRLLGEALARREGAVGGDGNEKRVAHEQLHFERAFHGQRHKPDIRLPAFHDVLKLCLVIAAGDAQIDMRVRLGEALRYLR